MPKEAFASESHARACGCLPARDGWLMLAAEMAGLADDGRRARFATYTIGGGSRSITAARDFTVATLHRWGGAERIADIAIVVSELLTNALRHALPACGDTRLRRRIRLGLVQLGSCVLCAVSDPSTAAPVPQTPGSLAESGRGLQIVCALSDQWGYTTSGQAGKVVWAVLGQRADQGATHHPAFGIIGRPA